MAFSMMVHPAAQFPFVSIKAAAELCEQGGVPSEAVTKSNKHRRQLDTTTLEQLPSLTPPPPSAMSKRVHFATTNTVYSASSASPSPSLTVSSLPSSSSPDISTPPPEEVEQFEPSVYPRTPYATQTELYPDVVVPKQMQIHFLLAYAPYSDPAVPYDLSWPFSPSDTDFPEQAFAEPATSPPLPSLIIIHPALKLDIEVLPSAPIPGSYVSVMDVFTKLYRELRLAVHPIEYEELPDGEIKQTVDMAYYTRCGRIRDPAERLYEERKGLKKIDLLMGCTRFMGLSGTLTAADVWELNVS